MITPFLILAILLHVTVLKNAINEPADAALVVTKSEHLSNLFSKQEWQTIIEKQQKAGHHYASILAQRLAAFTPKLQKIGVEGYISIGDTDVRKKVISDATREIGTKELGEMINNYAKTSAHHANMVFSSGSLSNLLHPIDVAKISVQFNEQGLPNSINPTINNNFNIALLKAAKTSAEAALIILQSKSLTNKIPDKEWGEILKTHASANLQFTKAVNDLNKPYPHVTLLVARTILAPKAPSPIATAKPLLMGEDPQRSSL